MISAEREKYSPVVYWTSEWKNGKLVLGEINKESSLYKKRQARRIADKIWEGKKDGNDL